MTTHATALARLTGARAQHTITDATADLLDIVLRRHPEDCDGVRHITGRVECEVFRAALLVLGIGQAAEKGALEIWDGTVPPGGYVCAVCGMPVESEPCAEHGADQ